MPTSLPEFRNLFGHAHPLVVHFPVALLLAGAALEALGLGRGEAGRSETGRALLVLGTLGAIFAMATGLSLFRAGDFTERTLQVASMHRLFGLAVGLAALSTLSIGEMPRGKGPKGRRLAAYRTAFLVTALLVGLAGHYGGWIVFGWGWIWTP